ncbi:MAG TPA: glycine cleavage system protein GcvH [Candidatus Binatia bacterium]|nr:glycine cleavage system protein GcvH [Candidatus Binatia bacterium]
MPDLSGYRFTSTHEWVRRDGGEATVGITDHAQAELGDVIFLDLPQVGTQFEAGQRFGVVESVKAASDLYLPVSGTVTAVNEELRENPERVNKSPYEDGWLVRLSGVGEGKVELLDEAAYSARLEE